MAAVLTLTSVKQAFYAIVAANSTILAALGNGAASVVSRQKLRSPAPVAPFIAVAFGPMTGAREDVRTLFPTLWLYDDDLYGWSRLNNLAALIEGVLVSDILPYCDTNYAGGIGDEVTDTALQRPALSMRYQVRGRF